MAIAMSADAGDSPLLRSELDAALTAQLLVAWAGEAGEGGASRRLGWWRSDLVSEFGGEDLFRRLLPNTWRWATLQAAREAARRRDAELRQQDHAPDDIVSLFALGFAVDERLEERLQDLKRASRAPVDALPGLAMLQAPFSQAEFTAWVEAHGSVDATASPIGRRLKGDPPATLEPLFARLIAGLAPLGSSYPLPHFRRAR